MKTLFNSRTQRRSLFIAFSLIVLLSLSFTAWAQKSRDLSEKNVEELNSGKIHAIFPGGEKALVKYVLNNIHYPKAAKDNQITGVVKVKFTIDENGKVQNAKVVKSLGSGCDEEALRIVESMPSWQAAKLNGKNVASKLVLPIKYELEYKYMETN